MKEAKWFTADNETGTATLKQHAYVPHRYNPSYSEPYNGNKVACGKGYLADEDYRAIDYTKIDGEPVSENRCKRCIKIIQSQEEIQ